MRSANQESSPYIQVQGAKNSRSKKETKPIGQKERIMKMNNTMTLNLNEMEMVNGGWDLWGSVKGALIGAGSGAVVGAIGGAILAGGIGAVPGALGGATAGAIGGFLAGGQAVE